MFGRINKIANQRINKEEFRKEIENSQKTGEATPKFMEIIYVIAYKILRTKKFRKTVTIDWMHDCATCAVLKFSQNQHFDKFDLSKLNKKGEPCSPYSFYMTSIKRSIGDTLKKEYYQFFDLQRELMRYNSCLNEDADPFWDDLYKEDDFEENGDVEYCKTYKNKYNEEE